MYKIHICRWLCFTIVVFCDYIWAVFSPLYPAVFENDMIWRDSVEKKSNDCKKNALHFVMYPDAPAGQGLGGGL